MHAFIWLINAVLGIAWWVVIIHVIMSWLIAFNVINMQSDVVSSLLARRGARRVVGPSMAVALDVIWERAISLPA